MTITSSFGSVLSADDEKVILRNTGLPATFPRFSNIAVKDIVLKYDEFTDIQFHNPKVADHIYIKFVVSGQRVTKHSYSLYDKYTFVIEKEKEAEAARVYEFIKQKRNS